ncbi:BQ2448_3774 [Microbotryum intermedium]|uniref:BQ2448_3774 protein n=1 Tax=Microbotryum intermedium TaxID=269621 RepID=A0A238FAY8_9BASI|nr:BQ2448_3774 [Microbotryum intermedium]
MSSNDNSRWWCHVCGQEQPIIRAPEPTCSVCRDSFVEEVSSAPAVRVHTLLRPRGSSGVPPPSQMEEDSNDDPRDFGYQEAPGMDVNDGPFAFFGGATARQGFGAGAGGAAAAGGVPALRIITQGPDGQARFIQFGGPGADGDAQGGNASGGGLMGLLRAFGTAVGAAQGRPIPAQAQAGGAQGGPGAAGRAAEQRRRREQDVNDPGDPDDDDLPYRAQQHGGDEPRGAQRQRGQGDEVPLRNLAAFLGEAFGAPPVDPADDPRNNPFAEGGHDEGDNDDDEHAQAGNAPGQQGRGGVPGEGSPFDYFIQLLNALGGRAAVPLASNPRDYAWGEESFQNLLNDLMAQARALLYRIDSHVWYEAHIFMCTIQASGRAGPQPAPKEMIDELPRVIVTQAMIDDSTSHFQDCTICQDPATVGDRFLVLQCKHAFHDECLVPWLEQSGTCPTCRFQLVPQPVNGVLPNSAGEEGEIGNPAGATATATGTEDTRSNVRTEAGASGSGSGVGSGGSVTRDGEDTSGLPGSWPDAERSRSASRAAGRARAAEKDEERESLPIEDLD